MNKLFKVYLTFVFTLGIFSTGAYLVVKNSYSADPTVIDDGAVKSCPAPTVDPDSTTPAEKVAIADDEESQVASVADTSQEDFIELFVSPTSDKLKKDSGGKVTINLSARSQKNPDQDYKATINHISIFATRAGKRFEPTGDEGKKLVCSLAGTTKSDPIEPLGRLLGTSKCDAYGDCGSVDFDNPTEVGRHQMFAVAMKSDLSTPCLSTNVLGWSTNSESTITVYNSETTASLDKVLTLEYLSNVEADKNFNIHIKTNPLGTTRKIDHVSTLILKTDPGISWSEIDKTAICKLADDNVKNITSCSATGVCDANISTSLSQSGQHRLIGVVMDSPESTKCSTDSIIDFSKDGIITVASTADPGGAGTDDGGGSETGGGDSGSGGGGTVDDDKWDYPTWLANLNKSSIDTIDKAVGRVGWIGLTILGFIAVLAIVLAGMKYITAGGDQQKAQVAKKAVLFAVYGIIAATLAVVLVKMTVSEVQKIVKNELSAGTGSFGEVIIPQPEGADGGIGGPNASVLSFFGHENGLIWRIIRLAVSWAEVVAFFMILWASYLYMTSFGEDAKAESAKKTLIWAVIGLAVVLSANVIINSLGQLLA